MKDGFHMLVSKGTGFVLSRIRNRRKLAVLTMASHFLCERDTKFLIYPKKLRRKKDYVTYSE